MRRGNERETLVGGTGAEQRCGGERREVGGGEELLGDRRSVVGGVGRVIRGGVVVVHEAHEPGVLETVRLGRAGRHEHALVELGGGLEPDAVAARRPLEQPRRRARHIASGVLLGLELLELVAQLLRREAGAEAVEHPPDRFRVDVGGQPGERRRVELDVVHRARGRVGTAGIDRDVRVTIDHDRAEADRRAVPLPDLADAEHGPQLVRCEPVLIGCCDRAGVAHRGRLHRVLLRERRAEQRPALLGQLDIWRNPVGEARGMTVEHR